MEANADLTVRPVRDSRILGGNTMKRYRVREGSIADFARYILVGLVFGVIMGIVINSAYPM